MGYWCGTCGQPLELLYYLTYREVYAIMDGYEDRVREQWRMHRFTAFIAAKSNGAKLKRPSQLLKLKGDASGIRDYHAIKADIDKAKREGEDADVAKIARYLSKKAKGGKL